MLHFVAVHGHESFGCYFVLLIFFSLSAGKKDLTVYFTNTCVFRVYAYQYKHNIMPFAKHC